jgi:hypothetical protein
VAITNSGTGTLVTNDWGCTNLNVYKRQKPGAWMFSTDATYVTNGLVNPYYWLKDTTNAFSTGHGHSRLGRCSVLVGHEWNGEHKLFVLFQYQRAIGRDHQHGHGLDLQNGQRSILRNERAAFLHVWANHRIKRLDNEYCADTGVSCRRGRVPSVDRGGDQCGDFHQLHFRLWLGRICRRRRRSITKCAGGWWGGRVLGCPF